MATIEVDLCIQTIESNYFKLGHFFFNSLLYANCGVL